MRRESGAIKWMGRGKSQSVRAQVVRWIWTEVFGGTGQIPRDSAYAKSVTFCQETRWLYSRESSVWAGEWGRSRMQIRRVRVSQLRGDGGEKETEVYCRTGAQLRKEDIIRGMRSHRLPFSFIATPHSASNLIFSLIFQLKWSATSLCIMSTVLETVNWSSLLPLQFRLLKFQ